jgi:hypothetical protein
MNQQGFLPTPKKHHPRQFEVLPPTCRPPAGSTTVLHHPCRLTMIIDTRPRRKKRRQWRQGQQHRSRAGGNYLHRHRGS